MSNPRRRLVRPSPLSSPSLQQRQRQIARLRQRLERERAALARWLTRLRRAGKAFDKHNRAVTRLERTLTCMEVTP